MAAGGWRRLEEVVVLAGLRQCFGGCRVEWDARQELKCQEVLLDCQAISVSVQG